MSLTHGRETNLGGHKLARFELRYCQKFADWCVAAGLVPDTITAIGQALAGLPPEAQKVFAQEAVAQAGRKRTFDEPSIQAVFCSEEGLAKMAAILLTAGNTSLKDTEAEKIVAEYVAEHGMDSLADKLAETAGKKN